MTNNTAKSESKTSGNRLSINSDMPDLPGSEYCEDLANKDFYYVSKSHLEEAKSMIANDTADADFVKTLLDVEHLLTKLEKEHGVVHREVNENEDEEEVEEPEGNAEKREKVNAHVMVPIDTKVVHSFVKEFRANPDNKQVVEDYQVVRKQNRKNEIEEMKKEHPDLEFQFDSLNTADEDQDMKEEEDDETQCAKSIPPIHGLKAIMKGREEFLKILESVEKKIDEAQKEKDSDDKEKIDKDKLIDQHCPKEMSLGDWLQYMETIQELNAEEGDLDSEDLEGLEEEDSIDEEELRAMYGDMEEEDSDDDIEDGEGGEEVEVEESPEESDEPEAKRKKKE